MHWRNLGEPTKYLGSHDLFVSDGEYRQIETIVLSVTQEEVINAGTSKKEQCRVAKLQGEKPMILNVTNCKTISELAKSADITKWAGTKICIFAKPEPRSSSGFGLRIKAPAVKVLPTLDPKNPKWDGAVSSLKDGVVTLEAIKAKYFLSPDNEALLIAKANENKE